MEIQYTLIRKDIRHIHVRVRENGRVEVCAPYRVSEREIEKLLLEKQDFVEKALAKAKKNTDIFRGENVLEELEHIYYLGQKYSWKICLVGKRSLESVELTPEGFVVYVSKRQRAEAVLKNWYKNQLVMKIRRMAEEIYPFFKVVQPTFPIIQYRNMTSRWGSCNKTQGKLTFNIRLIQYSEKCIEYVVWHEFVHFFHPNHSQAFYKTLEGFMPDYKLHEARLKAEKMGVDS